MKTKSKYRGVTTIVSDILFEPMIKQKENPILSKQFGADSLYYDGKHYFPNDIKPSCKRDGLDFEIQVVFYQSKWRQDTFYITKEFKEFLLTHYNKYEN